MATAGWRAGASDADLERGMPYLRMLAASGLRASYTTPLGKALLRLTGSLAFVADSPVRVWEAIPPFRWARRTPALEAIALRHLEQFLLVAFGAHNLKTAKADVRAIKSFADGTNRATRSARSRRASASCVFARDGGRASALHRPLYVMMRMRSLGVLMLVLGGVLVALSRRHRAVIAQKLAQSRRFVSRRIVDRDARDREARNRWDNEGGATEPTIESSVR